MASIAPRGRVLRVASGVLGAAAVPSLASALPFWLRLPENVANAINRAMDLRGFRTTVLAGAEFDAIFHFGPGNDEIRQMQKERGLKGAIQWYEEK